jgi:hypothetical protein
VWVDPLALDAELLDDGQRLGGECLVELEYVDVSELEPRPVERLARRMASSLSSRWRRMISPRRAARSASAIAVDP